MPVADTVSDTVPGTDAETDTVTDTDTATDVRRDQPRTRGRRTGTGPEPRREPPGYSGIRSLCPTLMRSGLSSTSRFASKIFMYRLALP